MTAGRSADEPRRGMLPATHRDPERSSGLEALARAVQVGLAVPMAVVALVEPERVVVLASVGEADVDAARRGMPLFESFCHRVADDRRPLILDDASLDRATSDSDATEDVGASAWIGMPVLVEGSDEIGVLCAIDHVPRVWTARHLELLRALAEAARVMMSASTKALDATEAQTAVDAHVVATRRVEAELRRERENRAAELQHMARRLQQGLLPRLHVASASAEVLSLYQPGEQRMLLGGDFLDVYEHPSGALSLLIGDVSGHGPDAASFAVGLRAAWRALLLTGTGPTRILAALNDIAHSERRDPEMFATVCYCLLAPKRDQLTWASAGHPPPLLLERATRQLVGRPGPPLGVVDCGDWTPTRTTLSPRAAVLLYTDGLIEGRRGPDADARYGSDALIQSIDEVRTKTPLDQASLEAIVAAARHANGAPLADDVAMLLTSLRPGPAPKKF